MKHLTLLIACLLTFSFSFVSGQDSLKTFNHRWGTELNINPLDGSFSLNNTKGQLKFRKFMPNNTAYRLAFTVNFKKEKSVLDSPYGTNPTNNEYKSSSLLLSINFGQEKHFSGSRRISPYIGYEAGFGIKLSRDYTKTLSGERTIKGAWEIIPNNYPYSNPYYTERGFWSLGMNILTGIDVYLVKNFYVGCEVAFGLNYVNYSNVEIDDDINENTYPDIDDVEWNFGPKIVNGIRIGYIF